MRNKDWVKKWEERYIVCVHWRNLMADYTCDFVCVRASERTFFVERIIHPHLLNCHVTRDRNAFRRIHEPNITTNRRAKYLIELDDEVFMHKCVCVRRSEWGDWHWSVGVRSICSWAGAHLPCWAMAQLGIFCVVPIWVTSMICTSHVLTTSMKCFQPLD